MSLSGYAEKSLPSGSGFHFRLRERPYAQRLVATLGDSPAVEAVLATLFWDIATGTDAFIEMLDRNELRPRLDHDVAMLVVPCDSKKDPRFGLMVLHRGSPLEARAEWFRSLEIDDLRHAKQDWIARHSLRAFELLRRGYGQDAYMLTLRLMEAATDEFLRDVLQQSRQGLHVVFGELPPIEYTSVPRSEWGAGAAGRQPTSTVGAIARWKRGKDLCVTVCRHALPAQSRAIAAAVELSAAGATQIGRVLAEDPISDSVIVSLPDPKDPSFRRKSTSGPLRGRTPTAFSRASFTGHASKRQRTIVEAWDKSILFFDPLIQSKVYTRADTRPGDSGAALIDADGNILGFALYTTGATHPARHSGWVWADSVYRAHKLAAI